MLAYSYSYGLQKMRLRHLVFSYSFFWLFFCQGMVFYFSKRLLFFYIWASIGSKGKRKKERKEKSTEILNIHFKLEISFIWTNDPLKRIGDHSNSVSECTLRKKLLQVRSRTVDNKLLALTFTQYFYHTLK